LNNSEEWSSYKEEDVDKAKFVKETLLKDILGQG